MSTSGESQAPEQSKIIRNRESSIIGSARVIEEELDEEDLTFENLVATQSDSDNTMICHHSKDVSYGALIE